MAFLTPDKIRNEYGLEIKEKIIPNGNKLKPNRKLSNGTGKVEWVTIHNTDDIDEAQGTNDAEQYARATYNGNMGGVTVHYYIDEIDCWQLLNEDEVGYHAADSYTVKDKVIDGPGNGTSIAIEIIMDGSGFKTDVDAENRGALLAAILLHKHGLTIDRLTTHNHWYPKKYCPIYILPHWNQFKNKVIAYLESINKANDLRDIEEGEKYILQAGAFSKELKDNAEIFAESIRKKGFDAYIVLEDEYYKVITGSFIDKNNALNSKATIEDAGIDVIVKIVNDVILGDVDGDGKISAADARLILRASVGLEEIDANIADIDGDGKVTAADARLALRKSVGLNEASLEIGDVDGDSKVTAADARLASRTAVGLEKLIEEQMKAADMNGDGKITASDARDIARKSVELE